MASEIDARLEKFGPRDVTVIGTNGLLRVLPFAESVPPVASVAEVTAAMLGGPQPEVVARAEQLVADDGSRKALWLTTGLDAGDGIITVFSSIKSAIALYMGRKSGKVAPAGWSSHQAGDAVLKAIALGYLLDLCFPGSEDPVLELAQLPSGRSLLAYFAAAEVALPFVGQLADGDHALSTLLPDHIEAQAKKLGTIAGAAAIRQARLHLPAIAPTIDALVAQSGDYLGPFAKSAESTIPGAGRVVDTVGDVMAAGADVLPVYRFLGLRVVAEAAVLRAARERGLPVAESGAEWVQQFVDGPRRAAMPLPPSVTAPGLEDPDPSEGEAATEMMAPQLALPPVAAAPPTADRPPPVRPDVPSLAPPAVAMAVAGGAAALASEGPPASPPVRPPPANPPRPRPVETEASLPPPLQPSHLGVSPPSVSGALPPTNPPAPVAPPPLPGGQPSGGPPPLPIAATDPSVRPPSLPDAATEKMAVPPRPPASSTPAVPPPLPVTHPATPPTIPEPASPPPVAPPPVTRAGEPPPLASPPAGPPVPAVAQAPASKVAPPPVSRPPAKAPPMSTPKVAPPPVAKPPKPSASAPSPGPASSSGSAGAEEGGGISFTAIGVMIAVVMLLGCAGFVGLGGVGAVFVGAHQETTDGAETPAKTGASKGKTSGKQKTKSSKKTNTKKKKVGAKRKKAKSGK